VLNITAAEAYGGDYDRIYKDGLPLFCK
jgi:hypothetical protein